LEDGFRIGRIPFSEAENNLLKMVKKDSKFNEAYYKELKKEKQKFTYLRAKCINYLIGQCFEAYKNNYIKILSFEFDNDLLKHVPDTTVVPALDEMKSIVKKYIYKWHEVVSVEAAGFEVLGSLLHEYIQASNICLGCPPESRSKRASKIFDLLPDEYQHLDKEESYFRYLKIASYISGMTDSFAVNLFQRIRGIST
jgi:dGTPase